MIFNINEIINIYNQNNDKPWLFILVGLPSSGKSTIASEISSVIPNTEIVSSDKVRREIFGDKYVRSIKTFETAKSRIYTHLEAGKNVVFDATNVNRYKREPVLNDDRNKYTVVTVFLDETEESCMNRNHIRDREQPVPDYEITNAVSKIVPPSFAEGFDYRFTVKNQKAILENDSDEECNYKLEDSRILFEGRIFSVEGRDILDERGKKIYREIVKHNGASCIMPILPDGRLVFVKEYRSAIAAKSIAFPAGIIDPGEISINCAFRELEEETGYKANDIEPVFEIHSSMGFTDEKISVFIARDLTEGMQHFDGDEFLEVVELSLDEALNMVFSGMITSAPTVAGLFYLQNNREREKLA